MSKFIINGNRVLSGTVEVSGSKNAALPLIFATVLMHGISHLYAVPDISDVDVAIRLISDMGAKVTRTGTDITVDTTHLVYKKPNEDEVSKIRASSYLLGANLSRFGICHIQSFGGCNFDSRPIDMHVRAMTALGAKQNENFFIAEKLKGADIVFDKISVGATVNAILLASSAEGKSRIFGYAKEPHVISLVEFLRSAGADISLFSDRIEIIGRELYGGTMRVIPDMIEAGTYAALSVLTEATVTVRGVNTDHLASFFEVLGASGVDFLFNGNEISARGSPCSFFDVITEPYPGFPTDLQPQMAPLMAAFFGGRITEKVWHGRFGYLSELSMFGVEYELCPSGAIIRHSHIHCAKAKAPDLRGGAALMMCALFAEGESIIDSAEIIKRGYSDIVGKLRLLGADVKEDI